MEAREITERPMTLVEVTQIVTDGAERRRKAIADGRASVLLGDRRYADRPDSVRVRPVKRITVAHAMRAIAHRQGRTVPGGITARDIRETGRDPRADVTEYPEILRDYERLIG